MFVEGSIAGHVACGVEVWRDARTSSVDSDTVSRLLRLNMRVAHTCARRGRRIGTACRVVVTRAIRRSGRERALAFVLACGCALVGSSLSTALSCSSCVLGEVLHALRRREIGAPRTRVGGSSVACSSGALTRAVRLRIFALASLRDEGLNRSSCAAEAAHAFGGWCLRKIGHDVDDEYRIRIMYWEL